jgi:hypothetical protein
MKHISFGNRLTPALLTACVLLGVIVALEWVVLSRQNGTPPVIDAQPTTAADDAQLTRGSYTAPDFAAFSEILERPLFTEGRTPPEPPTPEQAATLKPGTQSKLTMRLEGIALTPVARVALIRDISSNKLLRLAEGAQHQGWVVESVNATSATLKRGEQTHELMLELNTGKMRKTPPPAPKKRSPVRKNRAKK